MSTSRIVTVMDGIQVIEISRKDADGFPADVYYYVQGEKYQTLTQAREAARRIARQQGPGS
ncbi:MAG: hypothetical protein ABSC19_05830 [Syntrophorhabdales bacterium]